MKKLLLFIICITISLLLPNCDNSDTQIRKPYPDELSANIGRGLVVLNNNGTNYLLWRMLPNDGGKYVIWRNNASEDENEVERLGEINNTFFKDEVSVTSSYSYFVSNDDESPDVTKFVGVFNNNSKVNENLALSYDLKADYKQAYVVTGDLTGDGELEVIVNHSEMNTVDPYEKGWMKSTDSFTLVAFSRDGTELWERDLGYGIEAGYTFAPLIVWDLDSDGKCEVILKTNKSNDPRNYSQEYITILNGENGEIIREARWPDPPSEDYNSNSRNFLNVAHLDGINPSIIVGRGIYRKQILSAYDQNLNKLWERFLGKDLKSPFENKYLRKIWSWYSNDKSRGSHSVPIADVDENGTEEIIWGEHAISEDGKDLWSVEERIPYNGHLDIVYSADMISSIPGKETFYAREGWQDKDDKIGLLLVDKDGQTIWSDWGYTHIDGGWASKIFPGENSWQFFCFDVSSKNWQPGEFAYNEPSQYLFNASGEKTMNPDSSWIGSFTLDWEGDGIREILTKEGQMKRFNDEILLKLDKGTLWAGDLYGDHREEIVHAPKDGKIYIIFNTENLLISPKITKVADRQYRNDLSRTVIHQVTPTQGGYNPFLDKQNN